MTLLYTNLLSITELERRFDARSVAGLSNDSGQSDTRVDANVEACLDDAAVYLRGRTERYIDWTNLGTNSINTLKALQLKLAIYNLYQRRGKAPDWVLELKKQVDEFLNLIDEGKTTFPRTEMQSTVFPALSPNTEEGVFHGRDSYSPPFFRDPADEGRGWD